MRVLDRPGGEFTRIIAKAVQASLESGLVPDQTSQFVRFGMGASEIFSGYA
jgi:hypothetical protein